MSFEFEMPESTDRGGAFLDKPGTYHLAVTAVDEQPTDRGGKLIDGFRVSCSVLAGTAAGQEKKETEITFFNPKMTDKNNGEFAKKKQARFVMAVGLLDGPRKPGERVTVDLQQAVGRQFIATFEEREYTNNKGETKKAVDLHFADIWHVDDPEAAAYPKSEAALKLLPAALRKKPEQFSGATSKPATASGGKANGTQAKAGQPAASTPAPATAGVSLDEL